MAASDQPVGLSAASAALYEDKPSFHVYSSGGWVNDPNGPLYHNGRYHIFYQNVTSSTTWTWGLAWGHASSPDMVSWRRLPVALHPSPGGPDSDGCFSGCATLNTDGVPTILYTGVTKKPDAADREGMPLTCSALCREVQMLAVAVNPGDPDLIEWHKVLEPWLEEPFQGAKPRPDPLPTLNCWRDPFVLERPSSSNGGLWRVMVGSCMVKPSSSGCNVLTKTCGCQTAGTALLYKSRDLTSGWEYEGMLAVAGPGGGAIWECPVLCQLKPRTVGSAASRAGSGDDMQPAVAPAGSGAGGAGTRATHFFCVSAGVVPCIYWLGEYTSGRFDMVNATGPLPLDLGDAIYAPNLLQDAQGRQVVWAWLQEQANPSGVHDYAGCISLPRLLSLDTATGQLYQEVLPEIQKLHTGKGWKERDIVLSAGETWCLTRRVSTAHLDLRLDLAPAPSGVTLGGPSGAPTAATAAAAQGGAGGRVRVLLGPLLQHGSGATPSDDAAAASSNGGAGGNAARAADGDAGGGTAADGEMDANQAAALTYDFGACVLEMVVGTPAAVQHHLQQQDAAHLAQLTTSPPGASPNAGSGGGGGGGEAAAAAAAAAAAVVLECDACTIPPPPDMPTGFPAPATGAAAAQQVRRLCRHLRGMPGEALRLRLLLDYSIAELFTGKGEVLTTRVYRGRPIARAAWAAAKRRAALNAAEARAGAEPVAAGSHKLSGMHPPSPPLQQLTPSFTPSASLDCDRPAATIRGPARACPSPSTPPRDYGSPFNSDSLALLSPPSAQPSGSFAFLDHPATPRSGGGSGGGAVGSFALAPARRSAAGSPSLAARATPDGGGGGKARSGSGGGGGGVPVGRQMSATAARHSSAGSTPILGGRTMLERLSCAAVDPSWSAPGSARGDSAPISPPPAAAAGPGGGGDEPLNAAAALLEPVAAAAAVAAALQPVLDALSLGPPVFGVTPPGARDIGSGSSAATPIGAVSARSSMESWSAPGVGGVTGVGGVGGVAAPGGSGAAVRAALALPPLMDFGCELSVVALGGSVVLQRVEAYEMGSCWLEDL